MNPRTLAEVADLTAAGESFDRCLANFLDGFYAAPSGGALADEPRYLAPVLGDKGSLQDAYLAAVAEELARGHSVTTPAWTAVGQRHLRQPWFAVPFAAVRAVLIHESPPAFRCRNLFVTADALSRA